MDSEYAKKILEESITKEEKSTFSYYFETYLGEWLQNLCADKKNASAIVSRLLKDFKAAAEKSDDSGASEKSDLEK